MVEPIIEDLTNEEFIPNVCDPELEICEPIQQTVLPHYPAKELYFFAGVSLFNAIGPALYYALSSDFSGRYYERDHPFDRDNNGGGRNNLEVLDAQIKQRNGGGRGGGRGGRGNGGRGRGDRGSFDLTVWYDIAAAHAGLWGASVLLFALSYLPFTAMKEIYAVFIEHVMSNSIWIIYIGSVVLLSLDAYNASDIQAYLELLVYTLFFSGFALFIEMITGIGAIKRLDRFYPYYDTLLLPSIGYILGFFTHVDSIQIALEVDDDDVFTPSDIPFESDPTIEDDIIIGGI